MQKFQIHTLSPLARLMARRGLKTRNTLKILINETAPELKRGKLKGKIQFFG